MNGARQRTVFLAGGTGYMGRALIPRLLERGHRVRVLTRQGSEGKVPAGCSLVTGSALDAATFTAAIAPADIFVHMVGVSHPAPWKAAAFRSVDLVALRASVEAAKDAGIRHFIYVSVAQPAPVMKAYIQVRAECEAVIRDSGLRASILRPWYVLGPGHLWPYILLPLYWMMERLAYTREPALRLGLVSLNVMAGALCWAVENPVDGVRVMAVPEIRRCGTACANP